MGEEVAAAYGAAAKQPSSQKIAPPFQTPRSVPAL